MTNLEEDRLIEKLSTVKKEYEAQDREMIDGWIRILQRSGAMREITSNPDVIEAITAWKDEMQTLETTLLVNESLDSFSRLIVMDRRDRIQKLLTLFTTEESVKEIKEQIVELLENNG